MTGIDRRRFMQSGLWAAGASLLSPHAWAKKAATVLAATESAQGKYQAPLVAWPEKKALRMHSDMPPLLETAREVFADAVTPNDRFFVRWHHAMIPQSIELASYRIAIAGNVDSPFSLSIDELKTRFEPVEYYAVKQCGGNSRSYFSPVTGGIQWGHGAMGCAHWKGARLKDVLAVAKMRENSKFVKVNGLERPVMPATPSFIRKLDMDECLRDDVIIAYEMNGASIPFLNGYPAVLIVPGYFADNWVKMIERIEVLENDEPVFYTDKAYRMPDTNPFGAVPPGGTMPEKTRPVKALKIKSVIAAPSADAVVHKGSRVEMTGVAFDSGLGIKEVLVSVDGGATWVSAHLDKSLGKYAFRKWTYAFIATRKGPLTLLSRAINRLGETQPLAQNMDWNPGGYQWNAVDSVVIQIV